MTATRATPHASRSQAAHKIIEERESMKLYYQLPKDGGMIHTLPLFLVYRDTLGEVR